MTNDRPRLSQQDLQRLMQLRPAATIAKILLFFAIMAVLGAVAWTVDSALVQWSAYIALGYMWMSIVTFMHEATHNALFAKTWQNWAFGIVTMMPLMATFVAFKDDHLEHHRYNRSPQDPDAFTMGRRRVVDFVLFYAYFVLGGLLSFVHFNLLYPLRSFNRSRWAIHVSEIVFKTACYWALIAWAQQQGVLSQALQLWLIPVFFFSVFNSMRFIAEHYETPWNQGNLAGTRTIVSNRLNSYFWNNINWHIGHHVYPRVPYFNLVELHRMMEPEIVAMGAIVDRSYLGISWKALLRGPETEARLEQALLRRRMGRDSMPATKNAIPALQ